MFYTLGGGSKAQVIPSHPSAKPQRKSIFPTNIFILYMSALKIWLFSLRIFNTGG